MWFVVPHITEKRENFILEKIAGPILNCINDLRRAVFSGELREKKKTKKKCLVSRSERHTCTLPDDRVVLGSDIQKVSDMSPG